MGPARSRTRDRTSRFALITGFLSAGSMFRFDRQSRHTYAGLDGTDRRVHARSARLCNAARCFERPLGMERVARFAGLPAEGAVEVYSSEANAESRSENSNHRRPSLQRIFSPAELGIILASPGMV